MKLNIIHDKKTKHTMFLKDGSIIKNVLFYKGFVEQTVFFHPLLDTEDFDDWEYHIERIEPEIEN